MNKKIFSSLIPVVVILVTLGVVAVFAYVVTQKSDIGRYIANELINQQNQENNLNQLPNYNPSPISPEFPQPSQSPSPSPSPAPSYSEFSGSTLKADFYVYFVDKVSGQREAIADFPVEGYFGPGCIEYDIGAGESFPPVTPGLCAWRTKLQKEMFSVATNSQGYARAEVNIPPSSQNVADLLAKSWIAPEVKPFFNQYKAPAKAGWDYNKFTVWIDQKRVSADRWTVEVEYVGFRGDTPPSFRNK